MKLNENYLYKFIENDTKRFMDLVCNIEMSHLMGKVKYRILD